MSGRRMWGWGYAGFFLDGLGTVLLGPLLPRLQVLWRLGDSGGGALLAAQFLGMSLGTVLVLPERRRAMLAGAGCSWLGLTALALLVRSGSGLAGVEAFALIALLTYGFGLGQAITALNLGVGAEEEGRSSRLSLGNSLWSVGAIVAPIVVSAALAGPSLSGCMLLIALAFPAVWLWRFGAEEPAGGSSLAEETTVGRMAPRRTTLAVLIVFAALMFLYGSAESCLSGWVTTYARRGGGAGALMSPLSTSAFWFGVAGGRAVASVVLRKWRVREALLLLVGGAAAASLGLLFGNSMWLISTWAALAGVMLGPAFAVIVAGVLDRGASIRQTGTVLAMCGVGATVMPYVLGVISQGVGSLREALVLPGLCLVGMGVLVLGFVRGSGAVRST